MEPPGNQGMVLEFTDLPDLLPELRARTLPCISPMLPRIFQRLRHRLFGGDTSYDAGLENEAQFWRLALSDGGKRWSPETFRQRMDPEFAFPPQLQELVAASPAANRDPIRVLDVGAGPLTAVGFHWPGRQVDLIAVDPLAEVFDSILDDLQLAPPIRTRKAAGEDLLSVFPADSFDIVVCSNALDHSRDPLQCVRQMFAVTRPGGWVFLWHYRNEAEEEGYAGLHQWNLEESAGDLLLWNRKVRHSCRMELGSLAVVDTRPDPQVARAIVTRIQKRVA